MPPPRDPNDPHALLDELVRQNRCLTKTGAASRTRCRPGARPEWPRDARAYLRAKEILTALAAPAGVTHTGVARVCAVALAAPLCHAPSVSVMVALHGCGVVQHAIGTSLAA